MTLKSSRSRKSRDRGVSVAPALLHFVRQELPEVPVIVKTGEAVPDGQALDLLKELQVFQGGLPLEDDDAEEFGFFRGERGIPAPGHQGQALPGLGLGPQDVG